MVVKETKLVDNSEKWLKAIDEFGDVLLEEAADYILEAALWYLEFQGAIDTGELAGSGKVLKTNEGWVVIFDAIHSAPVEFGRNPGAKAPPLDPLIDWIRRNIDYKKTRVSKSLMKWMDSIGLSSPSRTGKPTDRHRLVARSYYLQQNIAKLGIKERPYLRAAVSELRARTDYVIEKVRRKVGIRG